MYEKELVQQLGCSWKDAKELWEEACQDLDIDSTTTEEQEARKDEIVQKVTEIWETTRKEQAVAAAVAKKAASKSSPATAQELTQERLRQERRQADQDVSKNCLRCFTCALILWCEKKEDEDEDDHGNNNNYAQQDQN